VYFSSLLDSVVFKKLEKTFLNLASSNPPFCFRKGNNCPLLDELSKKKNSSPRLDLIIRMDLTLI
jgi:hypothetical protein